MALRDQISFIYFRKKNHFFVEFISLSFGFFGGQKLVFSVLCWSLMLLLILLDWFLLALICINFELSLPQVFYDYCVIRGLPVLMLVKLYLVLIFHLILCLFVAWVGHIFLNLIHS